MTGLGPEGPGLESFFDLVFPPHLRNPQSPDRTSSRHAQSPMIAPGRDFLHVTGLRRRVATAAAELSERATSRSMGNAIYPWAYRRCGVDSRGRRDSRQYGAGRIQSACELDDRERSHANDGQLCQGSIRSAGEMGDLQLVNRLHEPNHTLMRSPNLVSPSAAPPPSGRLRPSERAVGPAEGGTRWTGYGGEPGVHTPQMAVTDPQRAASRRPGT